MSYKIVNNAAYDNDYTIAYDSDGNPVVIDDNQTAIVPEGDCIYNKGEGYYWYVLDRKWRSARKSQFGDRPPKVIHSDELDWKPMNDE